MSVAYFAHELADAAVQKRVRMLTLADQRVTLLGFVRDRGAGAPPAPEGGIVLGRTQNQRLAARVMSVLFAFPRALKVKAAWRDADLIIARNLEMLALASLLAPFSGRPRTPIAYECLDIHRLALADGLAGAFVRAIERFFLKRVATIITSSPAFERNYFRTRQRFTGRIVLAENKVLTADDVLAPQRAAAAPWIIAWCGVLRCKRSFDLLADLAANRGVRIELWGLPALDQIADFHDRVAATPNMSFHGTYAQTDLPRIYGASHFAWAIDFYEAGANSDWLLPNRLYESLCYGAAPIAVAGVETARWLEERQVGIVVPEPLAQNLAHFFQTLTPESYRPLNEATRRLEPEAIRFTPASCRAFAAQLAGMPA
jgi:succinoglycan biosynthesis protein ExoL